VLEHLQARFPDTPPRYWRDKAGREVDFVLVLHRDEIDAIECKWNPSAFDPSALKIFRSWYPKGRNFLVSPAETAGRKKSAEANRKSSQRARELLGLNQR
jgi:hypothetical protein